MEIEKKYRIKYVPENIENYEKKEIQQGYLSTSPVVRIRKSNEEYYLTYKSPMGKDKSIIVNNEIEMPLTKDSYEHLREKADNHLITKTRYIIPLDNNHKAELDEFHGILEGLIFVEVEFESEEDARSFQAPDWFGEDVSKEKIYKNNVLSKINHMSELGIE